MKILRKITAAAAAAAIAATTVPAASALSISELLSIAFTGEYTKPVTQREYITPMTEDRSSARYKNFLSTKVKLTQVGGYYGATLEWKAVPDAMLYYVYMRSGRGYTLAGKTSDTYFEVASEGYYYVRPVTYDTKDRRILGPSSNKLTVTFEYNFFEIYDDYCCDEAEGASYISGGAAISMAPQTIAASGDAAGGYYNEYWDMPDTEEYSRYDIDGFKKAAQTPLSTFSADVDTASYANVRRMINNGYSTIDADAVRIEEFLNYFDYGYTQPKKSNFSVTYEYADCPWNKDAKLLMFGVQAKDVAEEPDSNLVFLIDVSGSMYSSDKLPLVIDSLKKLSDEMTADDRISLVTYSGQEKVLISGAYGNMKNCISDLADTLVAAGCTNGEAGINMAYDIAEKNYIDGGSNRVILATDGDLNVGISDKDELSEFISEKRDSGVYLTVLGFGTGNLKDNKMEALAKDGNGNYHYIDCASEASKVLVDERRSTLITVADDVKLQVEFNPALVDSYRLIGYDGRRLNNEDFTNDEKDAADMGAGQSITVMYEIIPAKASSQSLKYQASTGNKTDVCTLKCRYKKPGVKSSSEFSVTVKAADLSKYSDTGVKFRFASCVAEAAMALRSDASYGNVSVENAKSRLDDISPKELDAIGYSDDFMQLLASLV